jgi:hypothetical protein
MADHCAENVQAFLCPAVAETHKMPPVSGSGRKIIFQRDHVVRYNLVQQVCGL